MRKKMFALGTLCVLLACALRIVWVNQEYPNPDVASVGLNESLECGAYSVKLVLWEWFDGEVLKEIAPDYSVLSNADGSDYDTQKEKVALATIEICKEVEGDVPFDFTSVTLESGAWNNQWDNVIFEALNGEDCYNIMLEKGEKKQVIIPVILFEMQFSERQWKKVQEREYHIVFSNYPEKKMISY